MNVSPLAHITENGKEHELQQHLMSTAEMAGEFAAAFGFRTWGYLAGLWHDIGKYSPAFQNKIRVTLNPDAHLEAKVRVDHSTAGAIHAVHQFGILGRILAYLSAGHHAGLPDWESNRTGNAALSIRLANDALLTSAMSGAIPADILQQPFPMEKPMRRDAAFWIRMLFSCLVDADFLDTEAFFEPDQSAIRGEYPELSELINLFRDAMDVKLKYAPDTLVNKIRADVYHRCIEVADWSPGLFSLTVPTGGGKTLSSMAFALQHAHHHGHKRIIYVIPYTSIVEQTAGQFRKIFGEVVIEHHSNLDVADEARETPQSRLASENWDAPIIVTTNVQFFESLFASRTSSCRKLHNIVNSIVILDEAQLLPPDYLNPILKGLDELRKNYGATILFSTATQPAFGKQQDLKEFKGLEGIREIMPDPKKLYSQLKRVEVHIPKNISEPCTWESLAEKLLGYPSVLCIVNRRDDCRLLWSLMPKDTYHLSALMCGAHRSKCIQEIKMRVSRGIATRVISTQLVEAGVDVDFPVVYRAVAGLDSIAQAAGRCNREGLLDQGEVVVFVPPTKPPVGVLRQAAQIGAQMLAQSADDQLAPERFTEFFRQFYWLRGERLDKQNILSDLAPDDELRFSFRSAALNFHLIDQGLHKPVIVAYGDEGRNVINTLKRLKPERRLLRRLQRYTVNLPKYLHDRLRGEGAIIEIHPEIFIQGHSALYDERIGFCSDRSMIYNPDDLIA
jgi:CRISPR-associated endonuclease/helicase Cas3